MTAACLSPSRKNKRAARIASRTPADLAPGEARRIERAVQIKALRIECILNESFGRNEAERFDEEEIEEGGEATELGARVSKSMPAYMAGLYRTRLLQREEETRLFRQMNFLKYRAARLRDELSAARGTEEQMDRIESLLQRAERIRSRIVQANLRLVVSIAKKFVDPRNSFDELVSDGNVSLMRAVEKFDYGLGNRFSTYATYAIRRNFYRTVIKGRAQRGRFVSDEEGLSAAAEGPVTEGMNLRQIAILQKAFARLMKTLNERERLILNERFGFGDSEPKTFKELGEQLGVCKERIRQIQARAMEKLRRMIDEERLVSCLDDADGP